MEVRRSEYLRRSVSKRRLIAIDLLRGIIMVVMALDHSRDFISNVAFDPTNLAKTTPALFFSRWITHFCAPIFIFLAGVSMYLAISRGRSKKTISWFLFSRGFWLVFLELTVVRFAWGFNLHLSYELCQIFWAIGWSMIVLSVVIYLPNWLIFIFGFALVTGHNALDHLTPAYFGSFGWVWKVLHGPANTIIHTPIGMNLQILYPLIPWIGVMSLGYLFGYFFKFSWKKRRIKIAILGIAVIAAFVIIRLINVYGDPTTWSTQKNAIYTVMSFLNCQKYPPSLLYLLMTLGPGILFMSFFNGKSNAVIRFFMVYGRVPFFFYIVHIFLIHAIAVVLTYFKYGHLVGPLFQHYGETHGYGFGLPVVYLVWFVVFLSLYPVCKWYGALKERHRDWRWLSYL